MKFSVKLDGFTFTHQDPEKGPSLQSTALIDADCAEMAQMIFQRQMGINSTTRKFTIQALEAPKADPTDLDGPSLEDEIADLADTVPEEVKAPAPAPTPAIVPVEEVATPIPAPAPVPAPRGKGKRSSLVSDPDGLRDEIAKL